MLGDLPQTCRHKSCGGVVGKTNYNTAIPNRPLRMTGYRFHLCLLAWPWFVSYSWCSGLIIIKKLFSASAPLDD